MQLSDFLADKQNPHKQQGNPSVACNALYKTKENFNGYLTASQAIDLARHVLQKAQLILDHDLKGAVVHLWNQGEDKETLYVGLSKARKGGRRKKKVAQPVEAS